MRALRVCGLGDELSLSVKQSGLLGPLRQAWRLVPGSLHLLPGPAVRAGEHGPARLPLQLRLAHRPVVVAGAPGRSLHHVERLLGVGE